MGIKVKLNDENTGTSFNKMSCPHWYLYHNIMRTCNIIYTINHHVEPEQHIHHSIYALDPPHVNSYKGLCPSKVELQYAPSPVALVLRLIVAPMILKL
jgi:hypothetical protein